MEQVPHPEAPHPAPKPKHAEHAPIPAGQKSKTVKILEEVGTFILILGLGVFAAWGINQFAENDETDTETLAELPNYPSPDSSTDDSAMEESPETEDVMEDNGFMEENMPGDQEVAGDTTVNNPSTAPAPTAETYQSMSLAFSMLLPVGWTTSAESTPTEVVFYDTLHSGVISSVEVYDNSSNESLESLMEQLRRGPNISGVRRVTISGTEWIEFFSSASTFNRGIVTIKNGRIYYLNGELSKPAFADNLRFL